VVTVLCREAGDTGPNSLTLRKSEDMKETQTVTEQQRSGENSDLYVEFTVLEMTALYWL